MTMTETPPVPAFGHSVRIQSARKYFCSPDWSWDTGGQPFADFDSWNVMGGRGELHTPEGLFPLQAGDAFLLRPGTRYIGRHDPSAPLVIVAIHFVWLDLDGRTVLPAKPPPLHRRLSDVKFFAKLLDRMLHEEAEGRRTLAEQWFSAVLWELARLDRLTSCPAGPASEQAARLEDLCRRIRESPADWQGVDQMARAMNCHRVHLGRLFRKHRGISPARFLIESRIETARNLLLDSTHPIGRIAELTGYSDIHYFSKQFTALNGQTPRAFRRGAGW
jgi:AraC family transcriptional regulator, arabinose operon regulatory protein